MCDSVIPEPCSLAPNPSHHSHLVVITSVPSAGQYHRRVPPAYLDRSTSVGPQNWIQEFEQLNLPLFTEQYIRLVHVPLDVMQECLRLQLEMRAPQQPSLHSVKQVRGGGEGRGGEGEGEEWGRGGGGEEGGVGEGGGVGGGEGRGEEVGLEEVCRCRKG